MREKDAERMRKIDRQCTEEQKENFFFYRNKLDFPNKRIDGTVSTYRGDASALRAHS